MVYRGKFTPVDEPEDFWPHDLEDWPDDYDQPAGYAFCPECGTVLIFDPNFEGYSWYCEGCEGFLRDGELAT
jgi:hypothetical protein